MNLNHDALTAKKNIPTPVHVLVIDDELAIREAIEDILDLLDIEVLSAANGKEGVELFANWQSKISMVLLDMRMPVMSGEETYRHIRNLDPSIPVVISSGYGEQEARELWINGALSTRNVSFLRKPYAVDELLELVKTQVSCISQ